MKKYMKGVRKKPVDESRLTRSTAATKVVKDIEVSVTIDTSKVPETSVELVGEGTVPVSTTDSKEQKPKVVENPPVTVVPNVPPSDVTQKVLSSSIAVAVSQNLKKKLEFKMPELKLSGNDLFKRDDKSSGTDTSKTNNLATSAGLSSGPSPSGSVKKPRFYFGLPPLSTNAEPYRPWSCNINASPSQMSEALLAFLWPESIQQFALFPLDRIVNHDSTHALHAFQASLALAAKCRRIANEQWFLVAENDKLRLKVAELQKQRDEAMLDRNNIRTEYTEFALSMRDLNERHSVNVEEEAKKQIMIERIKTMIEPKKGESDGWDLEACMVIFARDYPDVRVNWGIDDTKSTVNKPGVEAGGSSKVEDDIDKMFGDENLGDDKSDQGDGDAMES